MRKAVGYVRVSGQGQVTGTGYDRQEGTIKAYAKAVGVGIENIYREAHTGTEAERPVFEAMLADLLSNGSKTIIVESLDRLARDLAVQMQIIGHLCVKGITLINASTGQDVTAAMQGDPMLRAMTQVQGVFHELDKRLLVRKLSKARATIREREGRCEGRKPFGARPGEAETLKRIMQLYRKPKGEDRPGFYDIANILNLEGHKTRSGKPWHGTVVKNIIKLNKDGV